MAHRRMRTRLGCALVGVLVGLGPVVPADDDGDGGERSGKCSGDFSCICCITVPPPKAAEPVSFLPPTPSKIVQGVTDILKATTDFVQVIVKIAV